MFPHTIRFAQAAAIACRHHGQLAHEYEHAALTTTPWHQQTPEERDTTRTYSRAATGLATDYQHLTNDILTTYTTHTLKDTA